jgi:hypothetical protein
MKPIHVEFAAPGPQKRWIWALAATACLGAVAATMSITSRLDEAQAQVQEEIRRLRAQHAREAAPLHASPAETADTASRQAALLAAARHLQLDLNPVFSAVERVDVPGAQLVEMVLERGDESAGTGGLRMVYAMDSMERVPAVSAALNVDASRSWRLESAGTVNGGVRGAWRYVGR